MRFHSLESRVVSLFIALILAVQLVGFFFLRDAININANKSVQTQLALNENVFRRLLDQNTQKILQGATITTKDYGFRDAAATKDAATIKSALANQEQRIDASFSMLIGLDKTIIASTSAGLTASFQQSILPLLAQAEQTGSASSLDIVEGKPYQLVILPIKDPLISSWVVMAVPINQNFINDIHNLLSMHVSIFTSDAQGHWGPNLSSLDSAQAESIGGQLPDASQREHHFALNIDDTDYRASMVELNQKVAQKTVAVLQISFTDAVAPYKKLEINLLILTSIFILLAIIVSVFTAKRMTSPLRGLAETARRLGAGDYNASIEVKRQDEIGDLARTFMTMRDGIAQRENDIRRLAYWDTLTQLPNRALFVSMLKDAILLARRKQTSCFVLMMDLDRFKNVNDVMGHSFGDLLLSQVGERLQAQLVGLNAKLARLGGDEFVILLVDEDLAGAQALADRIIRSLEKPISLNEQMVDLGAGIGIASFPANAEEAEPLLSRAEVAMYAAKRRNSGAVVYVPEIDQSSQQSLSLLSELREALDRQDFRLYVQPKVALDSGEVIAVEALIRWIHPQRGFIFPDQFIPFAEQTGFIRELTLWVLNDGARICREWMDQGISIKMSVNLSTKDLLDQDLPNKFVQILSAHKMTAASFCMEITESAIMDDPVRALNTLALLHAMEIDLSIDDFGTGYSSLAYLKSLPVDELKIDKSFVLKMEQDADDTKIVKSTIDLGHNMGLRVVAEGVENIEVLHLLREMGCDQAQGYYISKPMPADQFIPWLANWKNPTLANSTAPNAAFTFDTKKT